MSGGFRSFLACVLYYGLASLGTSSTARAADDLPDGGAAIRVAPSDQAALEVELSKLDAKLDAEIARIEADEVGAQIAQVESPTIRGSYVLHSSGSSALQYGRAMIEKSVDLGIPGRNRISYHFLIGSQEFWDGSFHGFRVSPLALGYLVPVGRCGCRIGDCSWNYHIGTIMRFLQIEHMSGGDAVFYHTQDSTSLAVAAEVTLAFDVVHFAALKRADRVEVEGAVLSIIGIVGLEGRYVSFQTSGISAGMAPSAFAGLAVAIGAL